MHKVKRFLTKFLLGILDRLDTLEEYQWPEQMNYDEAVDALLRQSAKGRATFNYRYVQALNRKDLHSLSRYVNLRYQDTHAKS